MGHQTGRWRGTAPLRMGSLWPLLLALVLSFVGLTTADNLVQSYCSNQNTADTDASSDVWQSNGLCKTTCQANYALAIVQGSNCWCSNYLPADQSSVSECNKQCPGYPYEDCGNVDTGMYGYILLDIAVSGTASATSGSVATSTASSKTSQTSDAQASSSSPAQAQTVFNSVTVTNERTVTPSASVIISTVTDTPQSSSTPPTSTHPTTSSSTPTSTSFAPTTHSESSTTWTATPVTTVHVVTISNTPVTQTVTSMPTVPPDEDSSQKVQSKGASAGLIAGVVIATVVAAILIAGILFCCWRRRKQQIQEEHGTVGALGSANTSGRPTRTTSVLSKTGLLEKVYPSAAVAQRSNTGSHSNTLAPDGSGGVSPISERRNSRPLFHDQRLNPNALMDIDNGSRVSINTLPDNRDFSRTLNIANPDPHEWD